MGAPLSGRPLATGESLSSATSARSSMRSSGFCIVTQAIPILKQPILVWTRKSCLERASGAPFSRINPLFANCDHGITRLGGNPAPPGCYLLTLQRSYEFSRCFLKTLRQVRDDALDFEPIAILICPRQMLIKNRSDRNQGPPKKTPASARKEQHPYPQPPFRGRGSN